ncbi:hypothetical protein DSAG12_03422 [Promethearchaeum syntrophicum]|uniref:Uncharacterized protein n=1 Tax=Promethearchaeum syntrophicum TaxID=2594042 RepID=A0A5B9DEW6_9ARCH|nr:hypothetical protein [Candidatus Prometheoarchaeum syntrophicum]QEE17585.1 hypothetical protein DSAG12_03422 [Candidatus Prometheoarchaeum syntrophicum]
MANVVKGKFNVKLEEMADTKFSPRATSSASARLRILNESNLVCFGNSCTEEELAKWEMLCNEDTVTAQLDHMAGKMYANGVEFKNGKFEF